MAEETAPAPGTPAPGPTVPAPGSNNPGKGSSGSIEMDSTARQLLADLMVSRSESEALKKQIQALSSGKSTEDKARDEKLKSYEKKEAEVLEAAWAKVPKERQAILEPIKKALGREEFIAFLATEAVTEEEAEDEDTTDKTKGRLKQGGDKTKVQGRYKPKYTEEIENATGMAVEFLPKLEMTKERGSTVYRLPTKDYHGEMRSRNPSVGVKLSAENAAKRKLMG